MKLTNEQVKKLKILKTTEEISAFFETEFSKLSLEDLDHVAGGTDNWDGKCPICGSTNIINIPNTCLKVCNNCDHVIAPGDENEFIKYFESIDQKG